MATLAQALEAAFSHIETLMTSLVPSARSDHRFARRHPSDKALRDVSELTGRPRLFEVSEIGIAKTRDYYTGAGYSGVEYSIPVDVLYPVADLGDQASWFAAALDDHSRILHAALDVATITGDGLMSLTAWDSPAMQQIENDPWFVMRLTFKALLHVEQ